MTPTETYEHLAIEFPAVWAHEHSWVNIHDGEATRLDVLTEILAKTLGGERAVVVIHATPGIGAELPLNEVSAFVAPHVLKAEIQVADPNFSSFVAILVNGVAAGWN
jgi:hypothetical protein